MARKDRKNPPADSGNPRARPITPAEIQQKEFRESFRGYNEREVDEFLDLVTEEVARLHAETTRLQEQLDFRKTLPLGADAEEVLTRARDEAERIVGEARARAGLVAGSSSRADPSRPQVESSGVMVPGQVIDMINRYLGREREFLQALASTVQTHIEAVKQDARLARDMVAAGSASTGIAAPAAGGTSSPNALEPEPGRDQEDTALFDMRQRSAGGWGGASGDPATEGPSDPVTSVDPVEEGQPVAEPGHPAPVDLEPGGRAGGSPDPGGSMGARAVGGFDAEGDGRVRAGLAPDDDAGEERSLKELFWGEE